MRLLLNENLDWRLRRDLSEHQVEWVPLIGWAGSIMANYTQSARGWIRCAREDGQYHGARAEYCRACNRSGRVAGGFKTIG
jgi:hypothetical protein